MIKTFTKADIKPKTQFEISMQKLEKLKDPDNAQSRSKHDSSPSVSP